MESTSNTAVRPLVAQIRLTVENLSPSQPTTNLPTPPPRKTKNSMLIASAVVSSFAISTKGMKVKAAVRAVESRKPMPLRARNPFCRAPSLSSRTASDDSFAGLPRSTLRRVSIESAMNTRPASATTHSMSRQPKLRAIAPATRGGAIILPMSPAKFTVPTAVDRPLSS